MCALLLVDARIHPFLRSATCGPDGLPFRHAHVRAWAGSLVQQMMHLPLYCADGFKLWVALALVLVSIVAATPYSNLIETSNPFQAYIALCIAFDKRVRFCALVVEPVAVL